MGICEGRDINVLRSGDPMILSVVGSRIAVSRHLAESVQVVCAETNGRTVPAESAGAGNGVR